MNGELLREISIQIINGDKVPESDAGELAFALAPIAGDVVIETDEREALR